MTFTLNHLLFVAGIVTCCFSLVQTDDECPGENMYIPQFQPCLRTCEQVLKKQSCLDFILNYARSCFCKPVSGKYTVLNRDGQCITEDECKKIYGDEDRTLHFRPLVDF